MKLTPFNDKIVVLPHKEESVTKAGIQLLETSKKKPMSGEVVSVGEGTDLITMRLKVGETVLYGHNTGFKYSHEGEDFMIMRQSDILAKLV